MSAKSAGPCKNLQSEILLVLRKRDPSATIADECPFCQAAVHQHELTAAAAGAAAGSGGTAASKRQLKRPWSAPAAKSGDAWTPNELSRYDVTVVPVDTIAELFDRSHITEANLPPLSADAKQFVVSCESINFISTNTPHFPAAEELVGRHVAKLVFLAEKHFSQYEGVVDDCVAAILHYLGFNKGPLVVLTKNILTFTMSNRSKQATADVTVMNVDTKFRLAVFEDKSAKVLDNDKPDAKLLPDVHEAQLVAEAIAAAMSNQSHPDEQIKRQRKERSKSEADSTGASAAAAAGGAAASASATSMQPIKASPAPAAALEDPGSEDEEGPNKFDVDASEPLFLLRVMGNAWTFYCAEISGGLLNTVATGQGPPPKTTIRRFMPSKAYLAQLAGAAPPAAGPAATIYDNSKLRFIDPTERHTIVRLLDIVLSLLQG